jgi:hypothetical protein
VIKPASVEPARASFEDYPRNIGPSMLLARAGEVIE